jgi:hypothetical protein
MEKRRRRRLKSPEVKMLKRKPREQLKNWRLLDRD